jgi:hypothetical protein
MLTLAFVQSTTTVFVWTRETLSLWFWVAGEAHNARHIARSASGEL